MGKVKDKIKNFPPFNDINEANQERKEALNPLLTNTIAKKQILEINAGFIKTIDTADIVISEGFSKEEAKSYIESFEQYLDENKDKIEALKNEGFKSKEISIILSTLYNLNKNDIKSLLY